jgi:uncharacterized protein (UPF0548 family)
MRAPQPMSAAEEERLIRTPFTYGPVGGTQATRMPGGYHHLDRFFELGHGDEAFTHAAETLLTWRMHTGAGLRVTAADERVREGGVVRCNLGPLPIPCRVVWVVDEPDRRGFGYGTLPGHPELGEEAFVVRREPGTDLVRLHVRAYSRPGIALTRVAGPLNRVAQRLAVGRYAGALRLH